MKVPIKLSLFLVAAISVAIIMGYLGSLGKEGFQSHAFASCRGVALAPSFNPPETIINK